MTSWYLGDLELPSAVLSSNSFQRVLRSLNPTAPPPPWFYNVTTPQRRGDLSEGINHDTVFMDGGHASFTFSFQPGASSLRYHRARAACFVQIDGGRGQGAKSTHAGASALVPPLRPQHTVTHSPGQCPRGGSHTSLGTANLLFCPSQQLKNRLRYPQGPRMIVFLLCACLCYYLLWMARAVYYLVTILRSLYNSLLRLVYL